MRLTILATRLIKWLRAVLCGAVLACVCFATPAAGAQTRIACVGEAMTHSAHREYDPEYPELMGEYLDDDFQVDTSVTNPMSGGMLHGSGTNFVIGNYGIPKGSGLDHPDTDKAESTLRHPHLERAEQFAPDVVVIGPYGPHEPYAGVPVSEYGTHFRRLVERVLAFESSPIVLISLPVPRDAVDNNTDRRHVYDGTLQVAEEMDLPTIDLWTPFLGNAAEFSSQNKLTLEGRGHMAQIVGDAILAVLDDSSEPTGAGGAGMETDDQVLPDAPPTDVMEVADAGAPSSDDPPSGNGTPSNDDAPVVPAGDTAGDNGSSATDSDLAPTSDQIADPIVPDGPAEQPTPEPATGFTSDPAIGSAAGPASVSSSSGTESGAVPNGEGAGLVLTSDNSGDAGGCAVAFATAGERSGLLLAFGLMGVVGVRRRQRRAACRDADAPPSSLI